MTFQRFVEMIGVVEARDMCVLRVDMPAEDFHELNTDAGLPMDDRRPWCLSGTEIDIDPRLPPGRARMVTRLG